MQFLLVASLLLQVVASLPWPITRATRASRPRHGSLTWLELAQFHFEDYGLTNLCVECNKGEASDPMFDCLLKFDWMDPNVNHTCHCEKDWQWDGVTKENGPNNTYNTDYFVCKSEIAETFQFKFVTMTDLGAFTLMLSHIFRDSKDFPSPTVANLFGQTNLTLVSQEVSDTSLIYFTPDAIKAKIIGVTI
ncbi:Uu.00g002050.m01.CDS01 [Anthostomella pinea]|uniref:Uu.00g002050.m01.CDS01 n=1 Tax=Anthostomella pinea TaxID=933095 RepID=A0AAI8YIG8_9PEZI|nr:Uu.00g002050.m01.CDS01 [Anthostomella pinea]